MLGSWMLMIIFMQFKVSEIDVKNEMHVYKSEGNKPKLVRILSFC